MGYRSPALLLVLGLGFALLGCSDRQPWPADRVHDLLAQCKRSGPAGDPICAVATALACYEHSDWERCETVGLELYPGSDHTGRHQFEIEKVTEITEADLTPARRWLHRLKPGYVHVRVGVKYCTVDAETMEPSDCDEDETSKESFTVARIGDRWNIVERNFGPLADFTAEAAPGRIDRAMTAKLCECRETDLDCAIADDVMFFVLGEHPRLTSCDFTLGGPEGWAAYFVVTYKERWDSNINDGGVEFDEIWSVGFKAGLASVEHYADEVVDWYNYKMIYFLKEGKWTRHVWSLL